MSAFEHLEPMLADDRKYPPFSHPDWRFEIKYAGWRMLAEFGTGTVRLKTRAGNDCSTWFPEIVRALEPYEGGPYITDGEVAVLDDIGRSDFNRLQDRALRRGPGGEPVIYCMFDLLHSGSKSLLEVPLALRKSLLLALFDPKPTHDLLVVESVPEGGLTLYAAVVQLKLEGLVAKQCDSPYLAGQRSSMWRKLKRPGAVPPERFKRS
jgi:bifunctional non-homologous end joining protein LigD